MNILTSAAELEKEKGNPKLAEREMARYNKLKTKRDSIFLAPWQTLGNYYVPNLSDINTEKTEGTEGWNDRVYDTTAIEAARICTTGQCNYAIPTAELWWQWTPPKTLNMEEDDDGAIWCGICTEIALDELARSNYYRISGTQIKSRTVFGTGQKHIEWGKSGRIEASSRKIGTYCIDKNSADEVDTIYDEFRWTARQCAQEFGADALPPKIKKAYEGNQGKNMDEEFDILHVIRPREEIEREPGKIDGKNKPFASIYIGLLDKFVIKESGYDEMPDSVTRFDDWGTGTVWGYSPAFETLPNVRQLNYIVRFQDAQHELRANPRIIAPSNMSGQLDLRPGGLTFFDPNVDDGAKPEEWMTQADVQGTQDSVVMKQQAVNRMFYTDIFQALGQITRKMTAYEVNERLGEKLEQLSPMFGRLTTEMTDVDLKRIFGLLFRAGRFPKPPRSMMVPDSAGKSLRLAMPEVAYNSRLALALKARQNKGMMDTLQFVGESAANMNKPELLDNWDLDGAFRSYAINQGMSARYERPMRQVLQLRQARAKQVAQERAMALAEQAATAAGKLGRAPKAIQDSASDQIQSAAKPAA